MRRVELPSSFDKKTKQTLGAIFPLKFYNSFNLKYLKNGKIYYCDYSKLGNLFVNFNIHIPLLLLILIYISHFKRVSPFLPKFSEIKILLL